MSPLALSLALSLPITVLAETGFLFATGIRGRRDLLLVVLVNVLTNPAVVALHRLAVYRMGWHRLPVTLALELAAVIVEGCYYRRYGRKISRPMLRSLAANGFSYTLGLVINAFI